MANLKLQITNTKQIPNHKFKTIPKHIAIIMDGNGRWAKNRKLPRAEGHRRGSISLKETLKACMELGVKYLSVYAFSTENWNRPREEVSFLMQLLSSTINKEINELHKNRIRVRFLGRIKMLPKKLQENITSAEERTKDNTAFNLNIMLSYGGRAEIVDALKLIVSKGEDPGNIDEDLVSNSLYTAGMPDPELLIRTASEMRVSNFMLWQIAYTELWVTDVLWPDFRKNHLLKAIESYNNRTRKFGGV